MSAPLLEAHDVGIRFGGLQALSQVSFSVGAGTIACIIGPNGAGKSTFLNILTGTLHPTEGSVRVDGVDLAGLSLHAISRLGVARKFQIPSVFPSLSVRQNVQVAVWGGDKGRRPAERRSEADILDLIGLTARAEVPAGTLAHGEKQWLEIGMLLATNPKLLLVDEPAAGMTDEETHRTGELLLSLAGKHSLIIVEHDMAFVKQIAKNGTVTVLHQGSVLCEGSFDEVQSNQKVREVYLGRGKHGNR